MSYPKTICSNNLTLEIFPPFVYAIDRENDRIGKARCHPDDSFDETKGALIAMWRLFYPGEDVTLLEL